MISNYYSSNYNCISKLSTYSNQGKSQSGLLTTRISKKHSSLLAIVLSKVSNMSESIRYKDMIRRMEMKDLSAR